MMFYGPAIGGDGYLEMLLRTMSVSSKKKIKQPQRKKNSA
jgi:hypothetical protein